MSFKDELKELIVRHLNSKQQGNLDVGELQNFGPAFGSVIEVEGPLNLDALVSVVETFVKQKVSTAL
jgi:hypothetical protein